MKRNLILLVVLIAVGVGGYMFVHGGLPFGWSDSGNPVSSGPPIDDPESAATGSSTRPDQGDRQPISVEGRDPDEVTLRYRVVIHADRWDAPRLEKEYKRFVGDVDG